MSEISYNDWLLCQKYELSAWGSHISEESKKNEGIKQNIYIKHMGVVDEYTYDLNLNNKSVIDIGGGPISILLRCSNFKKAVVVEPLFYSIDVELEYKSKSIDLWKMPAENLITTEHFDEVWIYNCLQHTMSPSKILKSVNQLGDIVRIFEWIDIEPHEGHPHKLSKELFIDNLDLNENEYKIIEFSDRTMVGKAIAVIKNFNNNL